jgi:hypothetical protein
LRAMWSMTLESLLIELSITGFLNSATTSRMISMIRPQCA